MGLANLPEELLSNISHRLGIDDVRSLRLCSKDVETKTFHVFAKEYFTAKAVHFTTDSLQTLVSIARSKKCSEHVKEVYVVSAHFSEPVTPACKCVSRGHSRSTGFRQQEAYKFYMKDQENLKATKGDRALLTEAFQNLPKLKIVASIDSDQLLPTNVDYIGRFRVPRLTGRLPEYTGPLEKSYGNTRSNIDHAREVQYLNYTMYVFTTVTNAIVAAHKTLRLEQFRSEAHYGPNAIRPRNLAFSQKSLPKLKKVFGNVSNLQLHFNTRDSQKSPEELASSVRAFAALFSNVSKLSLKFRCNDEDAKIFRAFMSKLNTAQLTELSLREIVAQDADICKVIARTPKLTELKLDDLDLVKGTWPNVLKVIAKLEELEHLHLMYLRESKHKAYFLKQPDPEEMQHHHAGFNPNGLFEDEWDDEESDMDSDDDDLPDLEQMDGGLVSTPASTPPIATSSAKAATLPDDAAIEKTEDDEPMPDYIPGPGTAAEYGERGFYICINDYERIMRHLKVFIQEYTLGEHTGLDHGHGGGLMAALGGFGMPLPGAGPLPAFHVNIPTAATAATAAAAGPPPGPGINQLQTLFAAMGATVHAAPAHVPQPTPGTAGATAMNGNPTTNTATTTTFSAVNSATAAGASATDDTMYMSEDDSIPELEGFDSDDDETEQPDF